MTEETSANESENEKVSTRKLKKSGKVDPKNQTFANSDGEKSMMEKIHSSANGDSVLKSPAHELEPKKISKGKLKKSASAAVRYLSEESEAEQVRQVLLFLQKRKFQCQPLQSSPGKRLYY